LQDARQHERRPEPDLNQLPNPDVEISEAFLADNAQLFNFLCRSLLQAAMEQGGAVDNDIREALDALVRTYRTLEAGLLYETRPANLVASGIQQRVRAGLDEFRSWLRSQTGMETLRDADVFGILVMLQRMEYARNNGRPRGRAFIDFLRSEFLNGAPPASPASGGQGLIVPA
jgi:hypothetical protein